MASGSGTIGTIGSAQIWISLLEADALSLGCGQRFQGRGDEFWARVREEEEGIVPTVEGVLHWARGDGAVGSRIHSAPKSRRRFHRRRRPVKMFIVPDSPPPGSPSLGSSASSTHPRSGFLLST